MGRLRRLWTRSADPIPDEAVPGLVRQIVSASRRALVMVFTIGSLVHWVDVLRGHADLLETGYLFATELALNGALLAVTFTTWGRHRAEWVAATVAAFAMAGIAITGLVHFDNNNIVFPYVGVIPLLFSALIPWRPRFPLALGVFGALVTAVAGFGYLHVPKEELVVRIALCVVLGVVAAIANPVQRAIWREVERVHARRQLAASERLSDVERFGAVMAHELKTPLAATLSQLCTARSLLDELGESIGHPQVTQDDLREVVHEMQAALGGAQLGAERTSRTVQAMREKTHAAAPGTNSRFAVGPRLETVLSLLERRLQTSGVRVTSEGGDTLVLGNPARFDQILTNLVRNGLEALEETKRGKRVHVTAARQANGVLITVEDDGPGVPEALRERIFDQGFTTKAASDGLGLGLWLCQNMAQSAFAGHLRLATERSDLGGVRFEWWLSDDPGGVHMPIVQAPPASQEDAQGLAPVA